MFSLSSSSITKLVCGIWMGFTGNTHVFLFDLLALMGEVKWKLDILLLVIGVNENKSSGSSVIWISWLSYLQIGVEVVRIGEGSISLIFILVFSFFSLNWTFSNFKIWITPQC